MFTILRYNLTAVNFQLLMLTKVDDAWGLPVSTQLKHPIYFENMI